MTCFLTIMSLDEGYLKDRMPCEDMETALRLAAPYFSKMARRNLYEGLFDVKDGELCTVYFQKKRAPLREDIDYIFIKTAAGLLELDSALMEKA